MASNWNKSDETITIDQDVLGNYFSIADCRFGNLKNSCSFELVRSSPTSVQKMLYFVSTDVQDEMFLVFAIKLLSVLRINSLLSVALVLHNTQAVI